MSEQPSSVVQAMIAVMRDLEAVGKDKKNEAQGFNFRGIDDVQNALHPLMAKHGVLCVPTMLQEEREVRTTAKGGAMNVVHLWVQFTFYGPAGDVIQAVVAGEAQDSGDKATNKALSAALKYCLLQTFMIPTQDTQDADASHEQASPRQQPQRPPAPAMRPQNAPQRGPQVLIGSEIEQALEQRRQASVVQASTVAPSPALAQRLSAIKSAAEQLGWSPTQVRQLAVSLHVPPSSAEMNEAQAGELLAALVEKLGEVELAQV